MMMNHWHEDEYVWYTNQSTDQIKTLFLYGNDASTMTHPSLTISHMISHNFSYNDGTWKPIAIVSISQTILIYSAQAKEEVGDQQREHWNRKLETKVQGGGKSF